MSIPLSEKIKISLKAGPKTIGEIRDEVGAFYPEVSTIVHRLVHEGEALMDSSDSNSIARYSFNTRKLLSGLKAIKADMH
jgi:hypothetical protein